MTPQAVRDLQLKLKAAGYNPGDIDGDYGPKTTAAVLRFQQEYEDLVDDGLAGPYTIARLDQAIAIRTKPRLADGSAIDTSVVPCDLSTWKLFRGVVDTITKLPVCYGPGRGLVVDGKFIVTHGPGALKSKSWKSALGHSFPSFHCTSLSNFLLSWLLRRNEDYCHAGNIPSWFQMMEQDGTKRFMEGAGWYRGFGDDVDEIIGNGTGAARARVSKVLDVEELYDRRGNLPTFISFAQSTRSGSSVKWWHHTGFYIIDHNDSSRMYRFAADGMYGARGWSGTPLRFEEITRSNLWKYSKAFYRCWGVKTADGRYGDQARPIAPVTIEL